MPERQVNGVYTNIAKPLPKDLTLNDVIKAMPKEVFHKDMSKAWTSVAVTIVSVVICQYLIVISPWYLLPVVWAVAGTAWTGSFVIGHDCGHLSFARSHLINDVVGIISLLPFFYPFESWRIKHNLHHNNTNKLDVDNAWQPFQRDYYESATSTERVIMRYIKGPLWFLASVGHWIKEHFFLSSFAPEQHHKVKISLAAVYAAAAIFFPTMLYTVGVWGLVKHWLIPCFLGFHFWMSTFTMIHHTLPNLPFLPEDKWSDVRARLSLTVHCEYPQWVEFLCHAINVHVPHHVSTGIPSYNLRKAHNALKAKFGDYMNECNFGWDLLKDVINNCHIYHETECYTPFDQDAKKQK
jgi:omega-6 fatty acid desaturase (delta-12 desaturase)